MYMKRFYLFIVFALCNMLVFAQSWVDDLDFNCPKHACYINDIFVKDFIGFDIGKNSGFTNISKKSLEKPLIINGIEYHGITVATCEKKINFITLEEVQKRYYPVITGHVIFMIDHYFIMNDVNSYKLDEDYISKCELLSSKDFDVFKNQSIFSIIRILTKRDQSSRLR